MLFLLAPPICLAAANYASKEAHCSFTIPTGWGQIPRDALQQKALEMAKENQEVKSNSYVVGIQKSSGTNFTYPYMLIQIEPRGQLADDDLKTMALTMNQQFKEVMGTQIPGKVSDVQKLGDANYNTKTHTILFSTSIRSSSGDIALLNAGIAGKDRITYLHYYCLKADIAKEQPVFMSMVNSFKYDQDYQYPESLWSGLMNSKWFKPAIAIVGPLSGAVVGLLRLIKYFKSRNIT